MSTSLLSPTPEVPSHRACAHCRSQKVRCIPDESNPDTCQRCVRAGKPCVFTPLQKRKQRKRTDTRVAELEREMRLMQTLLKQKNQDSAGRTRYTKVDVAVEELEQPRNAGNDSDVPHEGDTVPVPASNISTEPRMTSRVQYGSAGPDSQRAQVDTSKDVVDRGIISMATARQLFETYREQLFPHYPMVAIPEETSADQMRSSKPTLFLAIIAAAAGKDNPDISATLDREILHAYATKSLVHSQKSLEIVQALLISSVWYHPPNKFGQLKYYEYIHMAATMAMDIGLGTRPATSRARLGGRSSVYGQSQVHHLEDATDPDLSMTPRSRNPSPGQPSIESRRTFVACYSVCTGVSLSLRRPNMLKVSYYVRECVDYLERSSDALPSDKMLAAWVRLLMIGEEISNAFSFDDPIDMASITDLRVQHMLKDFARRLDNWLKNVSDPDMTSSLTIIYWNTRLFLYEIVLHVEHSPEDFIAPFQMGVMHPWDGEDIPTQVLADAVAECVTSSHGLIETFLAMDVESLRALPVLGFVRVSFGAFVLAKLCQSAIHPGSQLRRVLDRSNLNVENILDRAILHVQAVVGSIQGRVPSIFLALLFKLRQWCLHPELVGPPQSKFLEIGMQNPVGREQQAKSQSNESTGAHRVVDHSSTDETSLETPLDNREVHHEKSDGMTVVEDHEACLKTAHGLASEPQVTAYEVDASTISYPEGQDRNPIYGFLDNNDQMQLDQNFFQFFGNMNDLTDANFTSLDEWNTFSTDQLSLPIDFDLGNMDLSSEATRL